MSKYAYKYIYKDICLLTGLKNSWAEAKVLWNIVMALTQYVFGTSSKNTWKTAESFVSN